MRPKNSFNLGSRLVITVLIATVLRGLNLYFTTDKELEW